MGGKKYYIFIHFVNNTLHSAYVLRWDTDWAFRPLWRWACEWVNGHTWIWVRRPLSYLHALSNSSHSDFSFYLQFGGCTLQYGIERKIFALHAKLNGRERGRGRKFENHNDVWEGGSFCKVPFWLLSYVSMQQSPSVIALFTGGPITHVHKKRRREQVCKTGVTMKKITSTIINWHMQSK